MKKALKNVGFQKPREENVSGLLNCSEKSSYLMVGFSNERTRVIYLFFLF